MGSAKKIASGVIWSILLNVVNGVYGFIAVPILIRYFGKAEYGLIGIAMSINVYMRLMDLGFNSTNLRFFATWLAKGDKEKVKKLFQTSLAFYGSVGLLNAAILFVLSFFTQELFNLTIEQDQTLKVLMYILAVSALVSWFSSCFDQLISATENVAWIKKRTLLPKFLQISVLFITVFAKLSIGWYYFLTSFAVFVIVPLSIKKIQKETPFVSFIPKFDWTTLKEMLPYALNIFSFSFFQFSFYNLRPVLLGVQGTVESVADYNVLNGIIGAATMFSSVFMGALLPSSTKAVAQQNKEAFYRVAYDATKYISIVLCFCIFAIMAVNRELLTIYVGDSFLYLIPWLNVWLVCMMGVHNQAISSLILAGSDIRAISYSSIFASTVGLVLAWFLIPVFLIGGVVIAFVVYQTIQLSFYYFYYWPKKMQINSWRVFYYSFAPYFMLGFVLCLFVKRVIDMNLSNIALLILKGCIFAFFYGIVVLLLMNENDKLFFKSLIKRKK